MAAGHGIAMGLRAAYLSMHRQTDLHVARCGMTADQFVLLALLAEQDAVTQQQLVRRATSDPNTVRAMLVLLHDRRLVSRQGHPTDRRARTVRLTPMGRQMLDRSLAETDSLRDRLASLFTPDEAACLVDYLGRISRSMLQLTRPRSLPRSAGSRRRRGNTNRLSEGDEA